MRLYLDVNFIYDFFKKILESKKKKEKFILPEKTKFLAKISKNKKVNIFTSILTQPEVYRRLKKDYDVPSREIERMWNSLAKLLRMKTIKKIQIDEELVDLVSKAKFRSRINNFIHLFICMKFELTFLTGDKKIYEDGKKIYENIMNYERLKRRFK